MNAAQYINHIFVSTSSSCRPMPIVPHGFEGSKHSAAETFDQGIVRRASKQPTLLDLKESGTPFERFTHHAFFARHRTKQGRNLDELVLEQLHSSLLLTKIRFNRSSCIASFSLSLTIVCKTSLFYFLSFFLQVYIPEHTNTFDERLPAAETTFRHRSSTALSLSHRKMRWTSGVFCF